MIEETQNIEKSEEESQKEEKLLGLTVSRVNELLRSIPKESNVDGDILLGFLKFVVESDWTAAEKVVCAFAHGTRIGELKVRAEMVASAVEILGMKLNDQSGP